MPVNSVIKTLKVVPYVGLLPIRLGMNLPEVSESLGLAPQRKTFIKGGERWTFVVNETPQFVFVNFRSERAVEIEVTPGPIPVLLEAVDLLKIGEEEAAWKALLGAQNDPREAGYGTLVFDRLGIATSFPDEDGRSLVVFAEGVWGNLSDLPVWRSEIGDA
jgi:hypothetical protein